MSWLPLISGIFVLILGIFVFLKNKTSPQNILFALFCLVIFIWLFGTFMMFRTANDANDKVAISWDRFIYIGVVFIPSLMYHFSLVFTGTSRQKITIITSYLVSFLFLFLSRTDYFVKGLFRYKWGCHTIAQPLHHLFLILFWLGVFISIYNIYHFRIVTADYIKKKQASYILLGFGLLFFVGAFAFLPAYKIPIYPFPYMGGLSFAITLAYAIVAHKLMDINIVFRKITVYSLLISVLFIFSVIILFLTSHAFSNLIPQQTIWSMLIITAIFAIIFQPMYRWINTRIDRRFFKGTLPDVSKEKEHLEEELRRSERLSAIGMLASVLLHEIKNPLVPIRLKVEQLPSHLTEEQKKSDFFQKLTTSIPYEIDRITGLLGQLREFANPSELEIRRVDIVQVIEDRINFLMDTFNQRNIQVNRHYSCDKPIIPGDSNKLNQVFLNLFQNAIDSMPKGGNLTISCEKSTMPGQPIPMQQGEVVLISVQDTGFGIPKDDLNKIFDPFFSKKKTGTGLGLSISHQIIKSHGGMIQVESIVNKGTTFYIFLPK